MLFGTGIVLQGMGNGTVIEGNRIGTNASGSAALPNHQGIAESFFPGNPPSTDTRIGGTGAGQGNTIAFNDLSGVFLGSQITGVRISGNSIHDNGLLGIDLSPTGPTPNDAGDADTGPNALQNVPVLLSASSSAAGTTVSGTLDSLPDQAFAIEVFANAACDPSGFGEGQTFLGSLQVTTNGAGHAGFAAIFPAASGSFLSATATQLATGNTSEFSACANSGTWSDLGFALAGSAGTPMLAGSGALSAGSSNQLALSGAKPSSPATLIFGLTAINAPFKGGTVVPQPQVLLPLPTNAAGAASLGFTWPAGIPAATPLYFQGWIQDAAAPQGLSASNAVKGLSS